MDEQKQSLISRISQAQNILVTVSRNPSVDQLSAAIGLTLALNKLEKHGTAVFSGQVPSTIDFLKPEDTLEKNTDSLRDFIIALDKSKADKLRYKVEDEVVRIFITPYKTSLSERDLEFSQGDFNVDVVVALGVNEQQDLDEAISSHGRILHDATVATVSNAQQSSLGTLNWVEPDASSLSEMVVGLVDGLDKKAMDNQIATALLTGIVASTERFSNDKTSPKTMSAAAELMAAGANQQLIATELASPAAPAPQGGRPNDHPVTQAPETDGSVRDPGTLEISHQPEHDDEPEEAEPEEPQPQVHVDEDGQLMVEREDDLPQISHVHSGGSGASNSESSAGHGRMISPPIFGDPSLTANTEPEGFDPPTEDLALPTGGGSTLTHEEHVPEAMLPPLEPSPPPVPAMPAPSTPPAFSLPAPDSQAPTSMPPDDIISPQPSVPAVSDDETLAEIEQAVHSPHAAQDDPGATVDSARDAVEAAFNHSGASTDPLQPIAALNAQPLGADLRDNAAPVISNAGFSEPTPGNTPADDALDMPVPSNPFGPGRPDGQPGGPPQPTSQMPAPQAGPSAFPGTPQPPAGGQTPPPPVPPPMLPPLQ
jgi:hypothetical protein